jgi:hypothetical protein
VVKPSLAVAGPQTHGDDFMRLRSVMCIRSPAYSQDGTEGKHYRQSERHCQQGIQELASGELDDATDKGGTGARDAPPRARKSDDFGLAYPNNRAKLKAFFFAELFR